MRQQTPWDSPDRPRGLAPEDAPGPVTLSPVLEFLGIGMLLFLLLFS